MFHAATLAHGHRRCIFSFNASENAAQMVIWLYGNKRLAERDRRKNYAIACISQHWKTLPKKIRVAASETSLSSLCFDFSTTMPTEYALLSLRSLSHVPHPTTDASWPFLECTNLADIRLSRFQFILSLRRTRCSP